MLTTVVGLGYKYRRATASITPRRRTEESSIAEVFGMSDADVAWYRWDDIEHEPLNPKLTRKFVTGDDVMLAQIFHQKGCLVPQHSHHNEQLTWVIEGVLRFHVGERAEQVDVRAGEVIRIPGGVPHEAEALEDTFEVDIFSPPRQDWIDKTDAYLRDGQA